MIICISKTTNVFSHCMLSKGNNDPHLHFEDDNVFIHCMLSKGNNDPHIHFEDDNVFSHCMLSKGDDDPHLHFEYAQKATMSSSTFRRRQCLQSLHAFKRRQCPYLHFEDDNVFSHCMPSKGDSVLIFISKMIMSLVIACLQKATMFSSPFRR